jgi:hypothetical protein
MQHTAKKLIMWAACVALMLSIPLVLSIRGGAGWNWTLSDFVFMGALLFGAGLAYELIAKRMRDNLYRAGAALAMLTVVTLVWVNGAVGIIGDGPANLMYLGVIAVLIIAAATLGFGPRGMARALFAAALAQALVPVIALGIGTADFSPGIAQVFGLNAIFVALFAGSALLFRRAGDTLAARVLQGS